MASRARLSKNEKQRLCDYYNLKKCRNGYKENVEAAQQGANGNIKQSTSPGKGSERDASGQDKQGEI